MSIPSVVFTACPGCGVALELQTCSWTLGLAETEEGNGMLLQLMAFGGHVCWAEES